MNTYFSQKFTNFQKKDIKLEFSKKITKNEKIFLKLLFFKIVSDSYFLEKAEIRFEEILSIPEFSSINNFNPFFKALSEKYISFSVFSPDINFSGSFGILSSFILYSDYCQIFFTEEFKNCFSLKKSFFSLLEIEKFIFMTDSFSFGFYNNIIKNTEDKNEVCLPLSSVKMHLNADNKYERFFDFEKHILKKAIMDINTFTDFSVKYEKIKESGKPTNKIVSINFFITKSRQPYSPYDNTIYKMLELIKEKISNPEEIYRLFVLYVAKRGYKYVYDNIECLKNYSSDDFEKKLKKALLLDLAANKLKLYININEVVKSPVILYNILMQNINIIKTYYPKIDMLQYTTGVINLKNIRFFKDQDIFEFSNEEIEIYVKYCLNKKSIIRVYLPDKIIKKLGKRGKNENTGS